MADGNEQTGSEPRFFDILNDDDKLRYNQLKYQISSGGFRNKRGKRLEAFSEMLQSIKDYAVRGTPDDWKRCLVCGVCWVESGIAINTRQLRMLVSKCKSSINGSLHRMGYSTQSVSGDSNGSLVNKFPILKGNFSELRQWTIRQQCVSTPQPEVVLAPKSAPTRIPQPFLTPNVVIPDVILHDGFGAKPLPEIDSGLSFNTNDFFMDDPLCLPPSGCFDANDNQFDANFPLYSPEL